MYPGGHLLPGQNTFQGHALGPNNPNNLHGQSLPGAGQPTSASMAHNNMYPAAPGGLISPATAAGVANPSAQASSGQGFSMRPSSGSGGGALSNAGQMMMSSMHHLNVGSDRINS